MKACAVLFLSCASTLCSPAEDSAARARADVLRGSFCTYAAPPRLADKRVDAPQLIAELKGLHANTYRWVLHPGDTNLQDFKTFLPLARAHNIRVWVTVNPPSERLPKGTKPPPDMLAEYEQWAAEFARLSLAETNFVAWSIDDFVWNLKFFTPEAMHKIVTTSRAINPRFAFLPCCYFKAATPAFVKNYGPFSDGVMFPYRDESGGANLTNASHVASEVKILRERFGAARPIIVGVYANRHSKLGVSTPGYVEQVMIAAQPCADGVSVYRHPNPLADPEKHAIVKRLFGNWSANTPAGETKRLIARSYNSGFAEAHDSYNSMGTGSDGKIYYVLSSESYDVGAKMFCFDPKTERIQLLGDLTEACGEKGLKAIPQNKSHVNFVEANGKLYFATHIGIYSFESGHGTVGDPPPGYRPYPGGHFLAYDLHTGRFEDLAVNPNRDGIISGTMDPKRGRLYGLTWPSGHFLRYDVARRELRNLGPIPGQLPDVPVYRALCRSPVVNPDDGSVFFTTVDGLILRYRYDRDAMEVVPGEDMVKDYFGLYDPNQPGHMGYNWRQTFWREADRMIYGVHGNSGYLFRFDPHGLRIEVLDRLTSEPSGRSGMFDQFSFGYLGFALGPDGDTIHYLTGGPIYVDGKRVVGKATTPKGEAKGLENLHLVTWHIPTGKYADHGSVFYPNGDRPLYVNSIAMGRDGTVYSLGRITEGGKSRTDLFSVPGPLTRNARR